MGELGEMGLWGQGFLGFDEEELVEKFDGQSEDGLVGELQVEGQFGQVDEFV